MHLKESCNSCSPLLTFSSALHIIWNEFFTSLCVWINSEFRPCTQPRAPCTLFAMSSPFPYVRELTRRSASAQTSVRAAHYLRWVLRVFTCVNYFGGQHLHRPPCALHTICDELFIYLFAWIISEVRTCKDLREYCTLFAMSYSLRRSGGTRDFIILNKSPMKPPWLGEQNFNPILLPSLVPRMKKEKERGGHLGNPESVGGLRIVIFRSTSN